MTRNDLFRCMDAVDDEVLARSENTAGIEAKRRRTRWIAAAACLCLIAGLGAWGLFGGGRKAPAEPQDPVALAGIRTETVPMAAGYGRDLIAALRAEGETYLIDWASEEGADHTIRWYVVAGEMQDDWQPVGVIQSAAASRWDFTGDLQANGEDYIGCGLYRDPDLPGELWVKHDGHYEHFLSEKFTCSWIRHDGTLYLYADSFYTLEGIIPKPFDATLLPADAEVLGPLRFTRSKRLPDAELEITGFAELDQHRVYCSMAHDCLLVEIPNGAYGGKTAYWRFYPISPDAFIQE